VAANGFQPSASVFMTEDESESVAGSLTRTAYGAARATRGLRTFGMMTGFLDHLEREAEAKTLAQRLTQTLRRAESEPDGRVCPLCFQFDAAHASIVAPIAPKRRLPMELLEADATNREREEFMETDDKKIKLGR
jgi:hypothetical protein